MSFTNVFPNAEQLNVLNAILAAIAQNMGAMINVSEVPGAEVSLSMDANMEYRCTDTVTSLIITGFSSGVPGVSQQWGIVFTAGDTITVTVPDSIVWAVAEPIFTAGSTYWLSVVPLGDKYLAAWTEVSNESATA